MLALIEHPDQYRKLVADPSLLPVAVEEFLRWGSPVMHFRRTATPKFEPFNNPPPEITTMYT